MQSRADSPDDASNPLGFIPLKDLPRILPSRDGRRLHKNIGFRWASRGLRGVILRTVRLGGRKVTRLEWVEDFATRLANSHTCEEAEPIRRGGAGRHRRTHAILRRHGLRPPEAGGSP